MAGNRTAFLDVPLVTEERTGPRHKVVEISWNLIFSWTIIVDLKRVFYLLQFVRTSAKFSPTTLVNR